MNIAMIPARMGSQRLKKKNLCKIGGVTLIERAVQKCIKADCFDEIWINSENLEFKEIAISQGIKFHHRPEQLGNNMTTSEQYVAEFLENHDCDYLYQVHSIAPLMTVNDIERFVLHSNSKKFDCLLSTEEIQIECIFEDQPINFNFDSKTNSQELKVVSRVSWSITAWRRQTYLEAIKNGKCATYSGSIGFFPISKLAAHVIKTQNDLDFAEALLPITPGC